MDAILTLSEILHLASPNGSPKLLCGNFSLFDYLPPFDDLMGEGFILLTRGYGFMGGVYQPPFDTLKKYTFAYDMNLKLYM